MKPAVDEMFPEGAGPYVDLDEVRREAAAGLRGEKAVARPRPASPTSLKPEPEVGPRGPSDGDDRGAGVAGSSGRLQSDGRTPGARGAGGCALGLAEGAAGVYVTWHVCVAFCTVTLVLRFCLTPSW
ncbi:COP9 signalosome complex subunit 9 [Pteropus vampyrus]|uniref:COP9 signalosome complex subunit 9 n=1 Tax=Pteropus vampyrus TaxID=132908 RepID=A0A6P6BUN2_PTEVA|nr:COP9 signalosome complex subunit 9 [Pteropus vampyrus]